MTNQQGFETPAVISTPHPKKSNAGTFVGLGLVVIGFFIALIPIFGIVGWPLMLAGLILGIIGTAKKWQPMWANIINIVLGFAGPALAVIIILGSAAASAPATLEKLSDELQASQETDSSGNTDQVVAEEPAPTDEPEVVEEIVLSDYDVVINDATFGEDYSGDSAIIVDFTFTNNSDKAQSFMFAVSAKAFQNGVELDSAIGASESSDQLKDIKPGSTIDLQDAFLLSDDSEVTVEVTETFSFSDDILTSKVFEVN